MGLKEETIQIVAQKFGPHSAKKFEDIANQHNPDNDPKGFLDASINYLSKVLGPITAKKFFSPLYEKYAGGTP